MSSITCCDEMSLELTDQDPNQSSLGDWGPGEYSFWSPQSGYVQVGPDLRKMLFEPYMVIYTSNPSIRETEAGGSLVLKSSRPTWATWWDLASKKRKEKTKRKKYRKVYKYIWYIACKIIWYMYEYMSIYKAIIILWNSKEQSENTAKTTHSKELNA